MSLLDRSRTEGLQLTQAKISDNRSLHASKWCPESTCEFDRNEHILKTTTIDTLRSFCQTKEACKSFQVFEQTMLANDADFGKQHQADFNMQLNKTVSATGGHSNLFQNGPRSSYPINIAHPKPYNTGRKLSAHLPQIMFRKSSSNMTLARLTKSMTTGNIANTRPCRNASASTSASSDDKSECRQSRFDQLTPNSRTNISKTRARAVQDREARAAPTSPRTPQHVVNRINSDRPATSTRIVPDNSHNLKPLADSMSSNRLNLPSQKAVSVVSKGKQSENTSVIGESSSYTHEPFALPTTVNDEVTEEAIANHDRRARPGARRRSRKAESMKRFLDSGIREVRRMGRRVGNSVSGADDEL